MTSCGTNVPFQFLCWAKALHLKRSRSQFEENLYTIPSAICSPFVRLPDYYYHRHRALGSDTNLTKTSGHSVEITFVDL